MWASGRVLRFLTLYAILMSVTAYLLGHEQRPEAGHHEGLGRGCGHVDHHLRTVHRSRHRRGEHQWRSGNWATLEPLLLTPTGHRQIVLGKFLAALSAWPAAFLLSVPYVATLSHGDPVVWTALFWGALLGSLLAVAFVGFGMLVSIWSDSSRISLFVCLLVYAGLLIPAQLPTEFLNSSGGVLVSAIDPLESASQLLTKVVDEGRAARRGLGLLRRPGRDDRSHHGRALSRLRAARASRGGLTRSASQVDEQRIRDQPERHRHERRTAAAQ